MAHLQGLKRQIFFPLWLKANGQNYRQYQHTENILSKYQYSPKCTLVIKKKIKYFFTSFKQISLRPFKIPQKNDCKQRS